MINMEGLIERPDMQMANSFMHNLFVYEWPEFSDENGKAFLCECNRYGEPLRKGFVMFYYRADAYWFSFDFPKQMLEKEYKHFVQPMKESNKNKYSKSKVNK